MGLLGIVMLISLVSGVMAHPKVVKDLFLLRWRPSLRLTVSDLHEQVGVWGPANRGAGLPEVVPVVRPELLDNPEMIENPGGSSR